MRGRVLESSRDFRKPAKPRGRIAATAVSAEEGTGRDSGPSLVDKDKGNDFVQKSIPRAKNKLFFFNEEEVSKREYRVGRQFTKNPETISITKILTKGDKIPDLSKNGKSLGKT